MLAGSAAIFTRLFNFPERIHPLLLSPSLDALLVEVTQELIHRVDAAAAAAPMRIGVARCFTRFLVRRVHSLRRSRIFVHARDRVAHALVVDAAQHGCSGGGSRLGLITERWLAVRFEYELARLLVASCFPSALVLSRGAMVRERRCS